MSQAAKQALETPKPRRRHDPDARRMQLLWVALSLMGLMTIAFVTLVAWGLDMSHDYSELLLLIGLLAFVTCTVAYFADKERDHRRQNQTLIRQLKDTAEALDSRVSRLNKLCETSVSLTGTLDVNVISELVVNALVDQVRADAASLVLMDKTKGERLFSTSTGRLAEAASDPMALATAGAEAGPAMHGVEASPELADHLRAWERVREAISAPVTITDMVGGTLAAIRAEKFDPEDHILLTALANMSGKALENAELHQRLRQSYYRTLHALTHSLAAREPYSAAHGEAVTWLACHLAEELGLGPEAREALKAYAPLHDLGKIGIPDALLLRAGPLSDEEISIVRQHTVIGEEIIAPLRPGDIALAIIRSHHEFWNGSGYPDGLAGERIPLLARVVAVADAYHAMISHRPYRGSRPSSEAVQEINTAAGSQFDPTVVAALLRIWERGELAKFGLRLGRSLEPYDLPDLPPIVLPGLREEQVV